MAHIYLSLGSNIDRHARINAALDALLLMFGDLQLSPVYESDSVGFAGDNFFNLVVGITTNKSRAVTKVKIFKCKAIKI